MKEKDMQRMFGKYIQENKPKRTEVYELKIAKLNNLPFSAVKDHQTESLVNCATHTGEYHKIADMTFGRSGFGSALKKPFDCMFIANAPTYVILWFYVPRTKKKFYKINIFEWNRCKGATQRKSITEEMALQIAEEVIEL